MPNIDVVDMQGKKVGSMELSEEIFAATVNVPAMHLVVRSILANQRQGTQSALTRGMVRGGGRKIYRQKGTGNARHHGNRAPQFRHGGVVFAPQPRDYVVKVPKKVRRLAMKSALTSKFNEGSIIVVDEIKLADAKTKLMAEVLKNLGAEKKALLVLGGKDESVIRASKNIPTVKDAYVNTINVYDLLNADKIVVLKAAMENIQEVYA
ncbi:MAG: 50S ribosomal protein L4 [Clostridiales bacterium]|nr:50S ribosomal protein L4 [Clostridiales bacterium]